ncbi:hypothetical protein [Staphylococcus agnetis]|uniref:hypothetical protein n=1 Tax=Staphylococcus agnetis TaxID=985762 RepID=UPI00140487C5|nr:hypothetical protein [Staphylococcus agnetis]NJI14387.1 hypothetical protein [Staphylococcus agnetis]QIN24532.1 hypothetical protein GJE18_07135 [Staphylococcus agnetis]
MVKIKTKREMTLPELIQWGWDNKNKNREFYSENGKKVIFNSNGNVKPKVYFKPEDTFTVEIEEEITEETKLPRLIEMYEYEGNPNTHLYKNITIKGLLNDSQSDPLYVPKAFYMLNDDMTMTLLWKDGERVE